MATKVIWYSTKNDDTSGFAEVIERGESWCALHKCGFNQLVNAALHHFFNSAAPDLKRFQASIKQDTNKPASKPKAKPMQASSDADASKTGSKTGSKPHGGGFKRSAAEPAEPSA